MKCDKLKSLWVYCRDINENVDDEFLKFAPKNGYEELVEKSEVDEAIAELKCRITDLEGLNHDLCERVTENDGIRQHWEEIEQTRAENERLKKKLESVQASMYCDVVDAGMDNRRLKRALYNLRAVYADMMQKRYIECKTDGWVHRVDKWIEVERRCLKKAEEYK